MKYTKVKSKNRLGFFAIVYSLVIMLAVLQIGSLVFGGTAVVAVDEWNTTTKPLTGISIVENSSRKTTMLVSTPSALDYALNYAANPISNVDLTIELVNSIDMSAKYIKPKNIISSKLTKLTIIGHGNTISGLKYSTAVEYSSAIKSRATIIRKKTLAIGLISYISRPLLVEGLNLRVNSPKIETSANAFGALVGTVSSEGATISKCGIYGTIECTKITNNLGGLIGGMSNGGSINNCWSYCTIKSYNQNNRIGGLVGYLSCSSVYNCGKFEGEIVSTSGSTIGGLFGYANSVTSYDKCFNQSRLESTDGCVGGIIGELANENVSINDCYNNANLSCKSGLVIGGLVGQGASGLTFNRCYSNGELKRSGLDSVSLTEDGSFSNRELLKYKTSTNSDTYSGSWNITYNNSIIIQNNGGGGGGEPAPTNYISANIGKKWNSGSINVDMSNLCGNSAVYNNSVCRNTYSISVNPVIIKVSFVFKYNDTSHSAGTLEYRADGCHRFTNQGGTTSWTSSNQYYRFSYSSGYKLYVDYDLLKDIPCPISVSGDNMKNTFDGYISGINVGYNSRWNEVQIVGSIYYTMQKDKGGLYENERGMGSAVSISIPSVAKNNDSGLVSSTSDIKVSTLGPAFTTASGRNDDLPILKDFYWEYNS